MENKIRKTVLVSALLSLVSLSLVGMTLSNYTSSSDGSGHVNVAKWTDIQFVSDGVTSDANEDFIFNLYDTKVVNANVDEQHIAPGDKGSFSVEFGSAEVAYTYSLSVETLDSSVAGIANIKFYSDAEMSVELSNESDVVVNLDDAIDGFTKIIYWKWDYDSGTDADALDTEDGLAYDSQDYVFSINIEATQIEASAS